MGLVLLIVLLNVDQLLEQLGDGRWRISNSF